MLHYLSVLVHGIGTTVLITCGAFVLGLLVAVPVCALRMAAFAPLTLPARFYINVLRAVPPITWLFIIFFGLGSGTIQLDAVQASIIGLGLVASAYLAEIYRAGIESVPAGQWEAARAIGLMSKTTLRRVIIPQSSIVIVPPAATYAIGLLKESAIASVIGAHDITFFAVSETERTLEGLQIFGLAALLYIALSVPLAVGSRWLTARLATQLVRA